MAVKFQGIWTKHLQYYLQSVNSPRATVKYGGFLGDQSAAVIRFATNGSLDIGSVWYAENEVGRESLTGFTISLSLTTREVQCTM
jgi:hypothetical protein